MVNVGQNVKHFYGTVRAAAHVHAHVDKGPPVVALLCQLAADAVVDDVHVAFDEDRLHQRKDVQFAEPLLQLPGHDLAVDDAVPGVEPWEFAHHALVGVHRHFERLVADAVRHDLHTVLMSRRKQTVQLFFGMDQDALLAGIVLIAVLESGCPRTERSVLEHFERPDLVASKLGSRLVPGCKERFELLFCPKCALLIHAHRQLVFGGQFLKRLRNELAAVDGVVDVVFGVHGCDALFDHIAARLENHALDFFERRNRHRVGQDVLGMLTDDAVWGSVLIITEQHVRRRFPLAQDAQHVHAFRVDNGHVETGPADYDGNLCGHLVQVLARRHERCIPIVLVKRHAGKPAPFFDRLRQTFAQPGLHFVQRSRTGEVDLLEKLDVAEHVQVGIDKPGQHQLFPEIDFLRARFRQRQYLLVASQPQDDAVFDRGGAAQGIRCIQRPYHSVVKNSVHVVPPLIAD